MKRLVKDQSGLGTSFFSSLGPVNKVAFNTADRQIKAGLISFNSKEFLPYVMCDWSHYSLTFPPLHFTTKS